MLIGLTGKARSGKDTAFGFIHKNFNTLDRPVIRKSFAKQLKVSAAAAIGFTDEEDREALMDQFKDTGEVTISMVFPESPLGYDKLTSTFTGREYLQWYGTEAHRELFDADIWVDACLPISTTGDIVPHEKQIWIVTDARYPNEAERILELDGEVWQINRDEAKSDDPHASEQPLPDSLITKYIQNENDLEEFESRVCDQVLHSLTKEGSKWLA